MTGKTRAEIFISGDGALDPREAVAELRKWATVASTIEARINLTPDESLLWSIHFCVRTKKKRQVNAWSVIHLLKTGQDSVVLSPIFVSDHQVESGNIENYALLLVTALRRRQAEAAAHITSA